MKVGQTVVVENKAGAGGNIAHQLTVTGGGDGSDGSVLLFVASARTRARTQDHR